MTLSPTLLAFPVAIPLAFAALAAIFQVLKAAHYVRVQRVLALIAVISNFIVALVILVETLVGGPIVYQMGLWPAPFGITVYADALTGIMLTTGGLLALLALPYAMASLDSRRERLGYYPMALLLLMGANGAFITGDLFNLYVFYEVLLMSSFVLLALGGTPSQINASIRYVVLNLMGSMMLLLGAGITYGMLGTLNMAQIAERMPGSTLYRADDDRRAAVDRLCGQGCHVPLLLLAAKQLSHAAPGRDGAVQRCTDQGRCLLALPCLSTLLP